MTLQWCWPGDCSPQLRGGRKGSFGPRTVCQTLSNAHTMRLAKNSSSPAALLALRLKILRSWSLKPGRTLSYSFMPSLIAFFTYSACKRHVRCQAWSKAPRSQRNEIWSCFHGHMATHHLRETVKPYRKKRANRCKCAGWRGALRMSGGTREGFSEEVMFLLDLER